LLARHRDDGVSLILREAVTLPAATRAGEKVLNF